MGALRPIDRRVRDVLRRSSTLRAAIVRYRHRGLNPQDFFIASFPRSGNTWLRFLLAYLVAGSGVDYERIDRLIPEVGGQTGALRLASGSRLIKTHEPYHREYRRAVYLIRDVRDVVISWYRTTRPDRYDFSDFDAFVKRFMAGDAAPYGKWTDHVLSWLQRPADAEVFVMSYEQFQANTLDCLRRVVELVGIPCSDEHLAEALAHCSIGEMQRLQRVNARYLRNAFDYRIPDTSGTAGGWRHVLTERHLELLAPALQLQQQVTAALTNISVTDISV